MGHSPPVFERGEQTMKTFLRVAIATVAMVGLASAQPKTDPKADPKAAPKADPKAADPKAADPKAQPPAGDKKPAMEMPKAPTEVGDMGKAMTGTWKCKGDEWDMTGAKNPVTAT